MDKGSAMDRPKVSIILPTYNGEKYLRESMESCLGQSFRDFELIVVDDCSCTDASREIALSFNDPRVKYFRHDKNMKLPEALNTGFSKATGEYLTWTSDDNTYTPDAIASMAAVLDAEPLTDMVFANSLFIDAEGKSLGLYRSGPVKGLYDGNNLGMCFLYRRKVYESIGGYDPEVFLAEDYEYWLRAVTSGFRIRILDKCLHTFRFHDASLTGSNRKEDILEIAQIVRDKYIPAWRSNYQRAMTAFRAGDVDKARALARTSFLMNPFMPGTVRLMAVLYFPETLVDAIRRFKRRFAR
jgi:glycosyltransferase involved in cell wall biosynthesis